MGYGKGVNCDSLGMRGIMIVDPYYTILGWGGMFLGWLMIAMEHILCLRPSFMIRKTSSTRYNNHCTCVMSCSKKSSTIYRALLSQYD